MTRKHFVELARIIADAKIRFASGTHHDDVIRYFEIELAEFCARSNPKFNRATFAAASKGG
ncbi:MAG TPA: hypothetical protein VM656_03500 [Pyrinomonadaceae bacterium]|nr:hypothetical protein [Pyrinomonadaceae bacterium]